MAGPVNPLQQTVSQWMISLGKLGNEAWFFAGALFCILLMALSMLPLLPAPLLKRFRERKPFDILTGSGTFVVFTVIAIVVLRIPGLTHLVLNPDESGLILGARTLLHDPRFWISFDNTTLGPLSTFFVAIPGILGFSIDYTSIKVLGILTWCLVGTLMYYGYRNLYGPEWAGIFVLPLVFLSAAFDYWDYVAFNGEHVPVLLFSFAFLMHSRILSNPREVQPTAAILLGMTLSLVPLAKIQTGPMALAWGIAACILSAKSASQRVLWLVFGAAVPVMILSTYLTVIGAWHDFFQSYIFSNLLYASEGWNSSKADVTFWSNLLQSPSYFLTPRDSRGFFISCFFFTCCTLTASVFVPRIRRRILRSDLVLSMVLCAAAVICILMPKNNWTHYLLLLFVPLSWFTSALLAVWVDYINDRELKIDLHFQHPSRLFTLPGAAALAFSFGILCVLCPTVYSMKTGNDGIRKASINLEIGANPNPVVQEMVGHVEPCEPVAHWGMGINDLCRSGVSLGTRDAHTDRIVFTSAFQHYYLERWIKDLLTRQPRFVVDSNAGKRFENFRIENFPEAWAIVSAHYRLLFDIDGFRLFCLRNDCPP